MSFLSDLRRISGQRRSRSSRQAYESDGTYERRSFDIPVQKEEVKDNMADIRAELSESREALESIKTEVEGLKTIPDSVKSLFEEQSKDTKEAIHSENVRVYRNVQAVVVDEAAKIKESVEKTGSATDGRINTATVFAVLAFVIAVLHFAFDILCRAGVF